MADTIPRKYVLGGSSTELDRIHGFHESTVDHMGTLLLCPVDFDASQNLRILDSGTAAGRWLYDLQKQHGTRHTYIGTDITESFFPTDNKEGITYKTQDITQPWPSDWANSFDLVHQRFTLGAVRSTQLDTVVANLISLVKPGGWIQLMESDVSPGSGGGAAPVWQLLRKIYVTMGVEPDLAAPLQAAFTRAGLVGITHQRIVVPVGAARTASGDMGRRSAETVALTAQQLALGAKSIGIAGYEPDELDQVPSRVLADLEQGGGSYAVYMIAGRKPLE